MAFVLTKANQLFKRRDINGKLSYHEDLQSKMNYFIGETTIQKVTIDDER